jgi:hypothetical protein
MGLSKFAPPSASVPGVHSRRRRCSEELLRGPPPRGLSGQRGVAFGPELPPSGLVPPLPFLPTSAACSTWHVSGLLRPETDHGVRQVSGFWARRVLRPGPLAACAAGGTGAGLGFARKPGRWATSAVARQAPESRRGGAGGAWKRTRFPMAFPVGVTPFGAFPFTVAVLRHPSRLAARRSPFPLRKTEGVRGHGAWVDRRVRATAAGALSPLIAVSGFLPHGPARGPRRAGCLRGSPGLRALVRCEVRCVHPAFPPGGRPMLPWALPIEGSLMQLGSRCSLALPGCRSSWARCTDATVRARSGRVCLRRAEARRAGKPA